MAYTPNYAPSFYYPNNYYTGTAYPITQPMSGAVAAPIQNQLALTSMIWVDGEVGAKAYQIPMGTNGPVALWDTNDSVIYLKSTNQMGMPNPLQKIRYTMEENPIVLPGQSGDTQTLTAQYVTKDEYDELKHSISELKEMLSRNNQNGGNFVKNQRYKEDNNA